jgi:hypothetical protein
MLKQYSILTSCPSELKVSSLPTMEKIRLEIQLIQTKRVLLEHEVKHRITGVAGNEAEFHELYNLVRHVCCSSNAKELSRKPVAIQAKGIWYDK